MFRTKQLFVVFLLLSHCGPTQSARAELFTAAITARRMDTSVTDFRVEEIRVGPAGREVPLSIAIETLTITATSTAVGTKPQTWPALGEIRVDRDGGSRYVVVSVKRFSNVAPCAPTAIDCASLQVSWTSASACSSESGSRIISVHSK